MTELESFLIHKGIIDAKEFEHYCNYQSVRKNPYNISCFKDPSEELQILAVTINPSVLESIKNPCKQAQIIAAPYIWAGLMAYKCDICREAQVIIVDKIIEAIVNEGIVKVSKHVLDRFDKDLASKIEAMLMLK
jgi:hypothetical protein